jgi:hypothetical protein
MAFIRNGHPTLIGFSINPTASTFIIEKTVTPPGWDGGGMIDITSMRNTALRTRIAKSLVTLTEMTLMMQYAPVAYTGIFSMLNVNQTITVYFGDGSTLAFRGWINTFKPGEHKEGEEPLASVEIIPSNIAADGSESDPILIAA